MGSITTLLLTLTLTLTQLSQDQDVISTVVNTYRLILLKDLEFSIRVSKFVYLSLFLGLCVSEFVYPNPNPDPDPNPNPNPSPEPMNPIGCV